MEILQVGQGRARGPWVAERHDDRVENGVLYDGFERGELDQKDPSLLIQSTHPSGL